jgi:acetoacetyl-CoA synthetase
VASANLTRFMAWVAEREGAAFADYAGLYQWSIAAPERFWPAVWAFCGVRASRGWDRVLDDGEGGERMPGARWFAGVRLNFAENLLRHAGPAPALIARHESGQRREVSWDQLRAEVGRLALALHRRGVVPGDRIAGVLPNLPEAVIAALACAHLGAVWTACSPDFGAAGCLDRLGQIRPRLLFVTTAYTYGGQRVECRWRLGQVLAGLPSVEAVVVVPGWVGEEEAPWLLPQAGAAARAIPYAALLAEAPAADAPPPYAQLPFAHPLYILYTSGTTGAPKCIVHGAGGTLLQHLKELSLHTDLKPGDRFFYFTTVAWMMWHWLVSGLAVGATLVLYDGAPFFPQPAALLDLAAEEGLAVFGVSARYLAGLEKAGVCPARTHDLARLRTVLATGSPLLPASFDYVYREVKPDVQLSSISGGSDIISCFALGNPLLPVYRRELQCRGLGMRIEVFDVAGRPVVGQAGELVCTAPFPSMPVGFFADPDGSRYRRAYFERFPGVWTHGDWAELTARGGMVIHGRSDAVLNPGGVRIGTAEIYRHVEALSEVLDSLAVDQEWEGDRRIVLFVRLRAGATLDEPLRQRIRATLRDNASPRHVPAQILAVPDLPRTLSGKLSELAVREAIHGRPVHNLDALANPESLAVFRALAASALAALAPPVARPPRGSATLRDEPAIPRVPPRRAE